MTIPGNVLILKGSLVMAAIAIALIILGWATNIKVLFGPAALCGLCAMCAPLHWATTVPDDQTTHPIKFLKTL